jgi:16S rRNA (cytidine1402-2'-O)-methyltransferase
MATGTLYLIPTFLSESALSQTISPFNTDVIKGISEFIVEELKSARRFLRSVGYQRDFNEVLFFELNEHTHLSEIDDYLQPLINGKNMGLISEAGTPCVADPGADLVLLAHRNNIKVVPLNGPNSILLALMASGLNGQAFTFHGYLPVDKNERKLALRSIEKEAGLSGKTQIFIETPYRNNQLFEAITNTCNPELKLCIACNINSQDEFINTLSLNEWKKSVPDLHKKPAVFLLNF